MQKLRINDEVIVLTGKDKGKTGKVKGINLKTSRVVVDGVNLVKKAIRPTQENPGGGLIEKENAIHLSNVALYSAKKKKASKVKIETKGDKKVRVLAACGTTIS